MNKIYALILALLLTLALANLIYLIKPSASENREVVTVGRVIDGDTLVLEDGRTLRLLNINAPEKDNPLSVPAKDFLSNYSGKSIEIEITGIEKYGRSLARLYSPFYLNLELVKQGLASKFLVDLSELKQFYSAEEEAISKQKGIWKRSNFADCITTTVDAKKELALIKNSCQEINISGWILKDESRKQYKFTNLLKDEVTLHSESGNDTSTDLFWNQGNVWNDDRDTLYLFDNTGYLISHYSYGY